MAVLTLSASPDYISPYCRENVENYFIDYVYLLPLWYAISIMHATEELLSKGEEIFASLEIYEG